MKNIFSFPTCLLTAIAACICLSVQAQRVMVTYAGTGASGTSGDWGSCRMAEVNSPHDVCMDLAGNLYLLDQVENRIRLVSKSNGMMTTLAGGGTSAANGIPATSAAIYPNYMCIDAGGANIYVTSSNQIRKINLSTGIITTVAGASTAGFSGDGGTARLAYMNDPEGICIDALGNIYFVDAGNNRIREINAATGIISTIAGTGVSGYSGDSGLALAATMEGALAIAVDPSGNVFFSDQEGNYIREIVTATGMMLHIAGIPAGYVAAAAGGPAATTAIGQIYGIHIDPTGDLYCDDGSCSCVRIDMHSGNIYLIAGSLASDGYNGDDGNAINTYLNVPGGLWVDASGSIYIADMENNRMRKAIQLTHTPTFAFGEGQYINACPTGPISLDSQLTITDIDSAQPEMWYVLVPPAHGTLSGFPHSMLSLGPNSVVTPTDVSYSPATGYQGMDSFTIQVSDGSLNDIVTIYVAVGSGVITGPTSICLPGSITLSDAIPGGVWGAGNGNVALSEGGVATGAATGTDIIEYAVNTTCGLVSSSTTLSVAGAAPVSAGSISSPEYVCIGAPITVNDTASSGVWSVSNSSAVISSAGLLAGVSGGTDTVEYTISNGCGTVFASQVINIYPAPDAGSISGAATVCAGSETTLIESAPGGAWSVQNRRCAITSSGMLTAYYAGTDSVYYSVSNSCGSATTAMLVNINDCTTGVAPVASTPGVSIYPNPATSTLNLSWSNLEPGTATATIYDITGRTVLAATTFDNSNGAGNIALGINDLNDGVYIIQFNSGYAHYTDKFIVEK